MTKTERYTVRMSVAIQAVAILQAYGDNAAAYDGAKDMLYAVARGMASAGVVEDGNEYVRQIQATLAELSKDGM